MYLRLHRWIALVALALTSQGYAQTPRELAPLDSKDVISSPRDSENQKTASAIAEHIKQSGNLRNYRVEVTYQNGKAILTGTITDQSQKDEVLRLVQAMPQVNQVVDQLTMPGGLKQVQAESKPNLNPNPLPALPDPQMDPTTPRGGEAGPGGPPALVGPMGPPLSQEPTPIFSAPPPNGAELNPPRMPPYAWPTYAPYNNYSRVAYPLSYPYNAFPYIGPFYPFPKVPPGWRSVKLEWDDGYWWFSKHCNRYDWWRLRFH